MGFLACFSRESDKELEDARAEVDELKKQLSAAQFSKALPSKQQSTERPSLQGEDTRMIAQCVAAKCEVEALQKECDALKTEVLDMRAKVDRLNGDKEKHLDNAVRITRSLSEVSDRLGKAQGSLFTRRIISNVKQNVLSIQSMAVAQFAMHLDSGALLVAFKSWSKLTQRPAAPGKVSTENFSAKRDLASDCIVDAANPVVGA